MIGFTSVSLRSYTVEEVVDIAFRAGAEIIEWGSDRHIKTQADAENAKKLCDAAGIRINSYGTYCRLGYITEMQWREVCRLADIMGAKYIRVWLGKKGSVRTGEKEYKRILDNARKAADIAAEYGLVICCECHPGTYNDTESSSLGFLRDVDRENVKTYFQSLYRDEKSDKSRLFNTFSYVQDVHISFSELKRFQMFHKKDREYIPKIIGWLRELDFQGSLILEFTEKNKAENLIEDIFRLRTMWDNQK